MDGKIQIRHTVPDRILEAGSLLLTAGTTLYLLIGWDSFPERIPAHYNAAGEIDRWGTKGEMVFLPVMMWILYIGLTVLQHFPQISFLTVYGITGKNLPSWFLPVFIGLVFADLIFWLVCLARRQ